MTSQCWCGCHYPPDGTLDRAFGVSTAWALEAAVACPLCLNEHCPALLTPSEPPEPPWVWAVWVDSDFTGGGFSV